MFRCDLTDEDFHRAWTEFATRHHDRLVCVDEQVIEQVRPVFRRVPEGRFLELGFGTGRLMDSFHALFPLAKLFGIDALAEFVGPVRARFPDSDIILGQAPE